MIWVLVIVVVVLLVVVGVLLYRQRQSAQLREGFGPEYDRALDEHGDQRAAEAELRERRERRRSYDIKPLDESARERYVERWKATQAKFVDQPASALTDADELVARGHARARLSGRGLRPAGRRRVRRPPARGRELPQGARDPHRARRQHRGPAAGDGPLPRAVRRAARARNTKRWRSSDADAQHPRDRRHRSPRRDATTSSTKSPATRSARSGRARPPSSTTTRPSCCRATTTPSSSGAGSRSRRASWTSRVRPSSRRTSSSRT